MAQQDQTAPATKQDIAMLMESIGNFYDASERWKEEMLKQMSQWKEEVKEDTKRHFDVSVEQIRRDLLGANRAEIVVLQNNSKDHKQRIERLERFTGVVA
ncbi:MAG: hypothetical protein PHI23_04955 [Candidatus Peribacteraceae bacterium]|nr:hypothetical protein [Candidatus Peribacteraceae bacterium]